MSLRKFIRHTRLLIEQGLYETRKINHAGNQRALQLTKLEERVLFSASAIAPIVAEIAEVGGDLMNAVATADHSTDNATFSIADEQLLDLVADHVLPISEPQPTPQAPGFADGSQTNTHTLELVFLDSSISNLDQMISDLKSESLLDNSRTLEFVVLDSTKDGIAQITSALLRYDGIDGMHIVSHGAAGEVQLGSTILSLDNLDRYRTAISAWQYSMSDQADILFYGCDLAASADGQQLLRELSELAQTDVAGSEDLTGAADLGGDWDLEFSVGHIEATAVFSLDVQANWHDLLNLTATGGETLVNGSTGSTQATTPSGGGNVAMDSAGNYVVAWQDDRSGNNDIWAAVYNADGTVKVSEYKVHSDQTSAQDWANVAMAANGNFAVTWSDARSGTYETYVRLYNSVGTAITGETLVSAMSGSQDWHALDFAADGSFVVAFQSSTDSDIYFQRYNSSGVAQGSNTKANTYTTGTQIAPDIAVADNGSFIITWDSSGQDGSSSGVYAQRFNASGVAQGTEFRVNTYTSGDQFISNVAAASDGSFVVSWESNGQDGSSYGIYAQRYDASGVAQGSEFRVNTYTTSAQQNSNLDMNGNGDFLIAWQSNGQDGSDLGIYAQQFDKLGNKVGGETLVNTTTLNAQQEPSVAYSGTKAVVVWGGNGSGDINGIFTQRFNLAPDITSNLVLHNTFDSDASDSSGNNYNGTLTNGASIDTSGGTNKIGSGKLSLDGINDDVVLSSYVANFAAQSAGTISAWIKTSDADAMIFSLSHSADAGSNASLYLFGGKLEFTVNENSVVQLDVKSTVSLNDNAWHHVAVTVGASGNNLYIDGVLAAVTRSTGTAATQKFFSSVLTPNYLAIGAGQNSGGQFFQYAGLMDDVRVYDRSLSGADVTELYNYTSLIPTSTIYVTNTSDVISAGANTSSLAALIANDGGDGISLREAIAAANNQAGADTINFNISGTGVHTINVTSSLTISDAVTINATTDDSFATNSNQPAIILDGNNSFSGDGLVLTSTGDGSTIRGLVIRDFSGNGIKIDVGSNGNTIAGNYIGSFLATGLTAGSGEANSGSGGAIC